MSGDFDDNERQPVSKLMGQRKPKEYAPIRDTGWYLTRVIIPLVVALIAALGAIIASGNGQVVVTIVNTVLGRDDDKVVRTQVAIELTQTKIAATPLSNTTNATPTLVVSAPSPTLNPTSTIAPTLKPTLIPRKNGLYDDFSNVQFDGRLNPTLWGSAQAIAEDAKQTDGVLRLITSPSTDAGGYSIGFTDLSKDTFVSLQAKLMLGSSTGRNGNITLTIGSNAIPGGWIETGLYRIADGTRLVMVQDGIGPARISKPIDADTWYVFKVDFDAKTNTFNIFVNNQLLTSYANSKPITLLNPLIQVWRGNQNTSVDASVDDVYLYE